MVFIDTSFLIALCDPRDALHERAVACTHFLSGRTLTSTLVLGEFLTEVSRPALRGRAHELLAVLRDQTPPELCHPTLREWRQLERMHASMHDKAWSLTDCYSFAVMRERRCRDALTYDAHFAQAGFSPLLRRPS